MIELNIDKVQIKYLTGINKCIDGYPTTLDILYDSCQDTIDGTFYSEAKLENKYGLSENQILGVIEDLVEKGYIKKKSKNYTIINTPWG